jgi:hypothetical protein
VIPLTLDLKKNTLQYSSIDEILSRLTLPFNFSLWTIHLRLLLLPLRLTMPRHLANSIYVNIGIVYTSRCDNNAWNEVQTYYMQEFQSTTSIFLPTQCTFFIRTIGIQRPIEASTRLKNETEYVGSVSQSFWKIVLIMCESFSYLVRIGYVFIKCSESGLVWFPKM